MDRITRSTCGNITYTQAEVSCFVGQVSAKFEVQFFGGNLMVKILFSLDNQLSQSNILVLSRTKFCFWSVPKIFKAESQL